VSCAYIAAKADNLPKDFITALTRLAYDVHITRIREHESGGMSATNIDTVLTTDAMNMQVNGQDPEVIVIASGDSDYAHLYRKLRERGAFVEVIAFPPSLSVEVIETVSKVTHLTREHLFTSFKDKKVIAAKKIVDDVLLDEIPNDSEVEAVPYSTGHVDD